MSECEKANAEQGRRGPTGPAQTLTVTAGRSAGSRLGDDCKEDNVSPKARLDAADGAVNVPIRRRAYRTVIAVLVHSEQRVNQRTGAPFQPAHRPRLGNRPACLGDDNWFAALYLGDEARDASLRTQHVYGSAAHTRSLANLDGQIKPAGATPTCRVASG